MKTLFNYLYKIPKAHILFISLLMVILLGILDYLSGYEISFAIFYLFPVVLVAWFHEKNYAFFIAILSAAIWMYADINSGNTYSHFAIPIWNAVMRLGFYLITIFALIEIKKLLENEQNSARIDYLTGINNSRAFMEKAEKEIKRSARYGHPFTVAYIDIDHFKQINDLLGHTQGDILLRTTAKTIKDNLRSTDIVSRLGGDEFAVLLVETNEENTKTILNHIQTKLLDIVKENNWPVTFSIGAVTSYDAYDLDILIKEADHLMYKVKESGKNNIQYKILTSSLK